MMMMIIIIIIITIMIMIMIMIIIITCSNGLTSGGSRGAPPPAIFRLNWDWGPP